MTISRVHFRLTRKSPGRQGLLRLTSWRAANYPCFAVLISNIDAKSALCFWDSYWIKVPVPFYCQTWKNVPAKRSVDAWHVPGVADKNFHTVLLISPPLAFDSTQTQIMTSVSGFPPLILHSSWVSTVNISIAIIIASVSHQRTFCCRSRRSCSRSDPIARSMFL